MNCRYYVLFIILFSSGSLLSAQKNYRTVDKRAMEVPEAEMQSITQLATYLTATAKDDYEKARAIYTWITHHITYSDTTVSNGWLGTDENRLQQQPDNVLKNRSAVCEGFANLYKSLCAAAGLQAEVITGVVKQEDNQVSDVGHAWNAVQLEGQWHLSDPTWGSGYADYWTKRFIKEHQDAYFLVQAKTMIQSHLPDDPIWQLLANPITDRDFRNLHTVVVAAKLMEEPAQQFDYQDSIALWFQQDSSQQMLRASERILHYNPENAVALARLGNHFYNQSVAIFYRGEEAVLKSLDDAERPLDTSYWLQQFDMAEQLLSKGWSYYNQVKEDKLADIIDGLAPEAVLRAEFDYLRGMMHVWQVTRLYKKMTGINENMPESFYDILNKEAQQTQYHFAAANEVYQTQTGDLYREALKKVKLHEALLLNYLAKADGTIIKLSEDMSATELNQLATRLDRGEARYQKMLNIVNAVLQEEPNSILGNSFLEEAPIVQAGFVLDKGFVYQFSLHKKFQRQWDDPTAVNKKVADEMTAAYLKCNDYADRAFQLVSAAPESEALQEIQQQLRNLRSNMYAFIGDVQMRYLANALTSIKTESEFNVQKKTLLQTCDKVLQYYNQALEISGDVNKNSKSYLLSAIDAVKSTRKKLNTKG